MNSIELLILLLLLFMGVPDFLRRKGRSAMSFPVFVLIGVALGPLLGSDLLTMLSKAGEVGFLLVLFEVGLEIELPGFPALRRALRFALPWALLQYPAVFALAGLAGLNLKESLLAAATLTGVSVGMAHAAWKVFPGFGDLDRRRCLNVMIVLETVAILTIGVETSFLKTGFTWMLGGKLVVIILTIVLVARAATHVTRLFQKVLAMTTHWRTHMLVVLVLVVAALGERLGLSAPKTAFFLGLFMSRVEHDGKGIEDVIAPVSRQFLIPLFFVSLGIRVDVGFLLTWPAVVAVSAAWLLIGVRHMLHRRGMGIGGHERAFLLLCPNLTMVALGATTLKETGELPQNASWLLLTGLVMSVTAIFLLPPTTKVESNTPAPQPMGHDPVELNAPKKAAT
jgi:Kef-type K+ transport system membrane component KefB